MEFISKKFLYVGPMSHPSSWTQLNPTLIGAAGVPNFFIRKVSTVRNKVPQPLHFVRNCDNRKLLKTERCQGRNAVFNLPSNLAMRDHFSFQERSLSRKKCQNSFRFNRARFYEGTFDVFKVLIQNMC